jgi:hypothetical protein
MGLLPWIAENWFVLLQSVGIVGSLLFTGLALRADANARRISNLLTITEGHRNLWLHFSRRPELARVIDKDADLQKEPVTEAEHTFVTLLILHLSSAFHAHDDSLRVNPDGLRKDIESFFSLPIPNAVWTDAVKFQDHDFVRFVEECRVRLD